MVSQIEPSPLLHLILIFTAAKAHQQVEPPSVPLPLQKIRFHFTGKASSTHQHMESEIDNVEIDEVDEELDELADDNYLPVSN